MSQQDVKLRLAPGETKEIQRPGRFIFCKFSDRQVSIIMDQARIEMEAGDKHVSADRFSSFQVQNLDQVNEAYLIFVVGDGDFDRMIVQGEISIEPILRNADGTTKPDTRHTVEIDLLPVSAFVNTLNVGDIVYTATAGGGSTEYKSGGGVFRLPDGTIGHSMIRYVSGSYDGFHIGIFDDEGSLLSVGEIDNAYELAADKSLCWTAETGWIVGDGTQVRTLLPGDPGFYGVAFTWDKAIDDMTVDADGNIVLVDRGANVAVVDPVSKAIVKTGKINVATDPSWEVAIAFDPFYRRYYFQHYSGGHFVSEEFELMETKAGFTGVPNIGEGRDVYRNFLYVSRTSQVAQLYSKKVFSEYDMSPRIEAVKPFCGLNNALMKRTDPIVLTASITAREVATGIQIEGELIKAALEYYYRAKVPDDYLDHIYGFDVSRDKNGFPFKKLVSGNRTFKAAQIVDNLSTLAPSRVTVILDNEMKLGANL